MPADAPPLQRLQADAIAVCGVAPGLYTIPYGLSGLIGATFLGLGRALGETMAVTFVIGNKHAISLSLFEAGNTIASTMANEFTEASDPLYASSLVELGLILFAISLVIQVIAHFWLKQIRGSVGVGL